MAKKKAQFAKRNANIRKTAIIFGILAILAVATVVGFFMLSATQRAWGIEHNGERHPRAELEYFVFLSAEAMTLDAWQRTGQQVNLFAPGQFDQSRDAVDMARNHYLQTLDLLAFAYEHNITLSPHLNEIMRESAEAFLQHYRAIFGRDHSLSIERIIELDSGQLLFDELFEALRFNAFVDEEEFDELFEEAWETDRWDFIDMRVSYFFAPRIPEVNEFLAAIDGGMTFHEAKDYFAVADEEEYEEANGSVYEEGAIEYAEEENESELNNVNDTINENERGIDFWLFVQRYSMHEIEHAIDDVREIAELAVGEISHIINLPDGFAVVYMEYLFEHDIEEVRQEMWEQFEANTQWDYVWLLFSNFRETVDYTANPRAIRHLNNNVRNIIGA